ncbi:hypothetical protein P0082_01785 [Candidatus Haliotispira prima]|uniref:NERD domain-containing protein n=1 Tax=Candidatus Haliotispira prima TaxID=3034016 RepID=A0ABY8MI56_9SPIO|nr:hypothetical protein P0082_01785 [Candidatus Haliotispira prima]
MDNTQFDKMMQGMFQGMAELRESQAKTDLQLRESQTKSDLESQKLREFQAETSLQIRESQAKTDSQLQELERKLDRVGEILGSIGINTGLFAERLFASSFKENPVLGETRYDEIKCNVLDSNGKTEYDILLINGSSVAIVEVKYKAHPKDIEDLLEKK